MDTLLAMKGITKQYPGVLALDTVDFTLNPGEVHCLVGENGAGKSTLMKILSGAIPKDAGTILVDGRPVVIDSPASSRTLGIGMIYQDFKLVPELSAAENILLGSEPIRKVIPFIDSDAMHRTARAALQQLGEDLDTGVPVRRLSVAQRQIVEIAKAISRNVRILGLDEPTAPLTEHEIAGLFAVIRKLKADGVGIIYISHRLEEVFEIGDRVTVLRDGKVVDTYPVAGVDRRSLIKAMVGRELEKEYPKIDLTRGREILRLDHVRSPELHDINLTVYTGEILGFAGLVGAGRTELARVLFGADPMTGGSIALDGQPIRPRSPHDAIKAGIGLLTEDRNRLGLIMQMNVRQNISLANLMDIMRGPFIDTTREESIARKFVEELRLRPPSTDMNVEKLSGGNRQKVILARWLNTKAKVLIFDEPTAGIDVGVKYEIYTLINRLAQNGIGTIVISSDLPELLGICDRIAVMCEGRITGILDRNEATQERIMTLATNTGAV